MCKGIEMRIHYQVLSVLLGLALVSGCDRSIATSSINSVDHHPTEIAAKLNRKFSVAYDRVVRIQSENLEIQFTDVVGDSRCPSETDCVWQGQVEIRLHITQGDRDLGNLNLVRQAGLEEEAIATIDGYSIKLIDVKPYPKNNKPIEVSDYTAILEVSR
jgi:hypothetical protein